MRAHGVRASKIRKPGLGKVAPWLRTRAAAFRAGALAE